MASEPEAMGGVERELGSKIGRYEVLDQLGRGGMGVVVKARNPDLNKLVAIKVLNSSMLTDHTSLERFKIEAKAGSQFSHPHLVSIFDFGVTIDGSPYMVMEYIAGESLQDKMTAEGTIKIDVMLKVFEQVVKALQYIHKQNIVHRDIKASNVMLQNIDDELYAKLVDFGIAKVLSDDVSDPQKLTKTGSVFGSPPYMSPEQCQGKVVDVRSDIYSLGCVMYECLRGVPPILGDNALQTIFGHVSTIPEPLEEMSSEDTTACAAAKMIHKCLEKDPAVRFQTCAELLVELSKIKGQRDAKQFQGQSDIGERSDEKHAATALPTQSSSSAASPQAANRWKTNVAPENPKAPPKLIVKNLADTTGGDELTPFSSEQRETGVLEKQSKPVEPLPGGSFKPSESFESIAPFEPFEPSTPLKIPEHFKLSEPFAAVDDAQKRARAHRSNKSAFRPNGYEQPPAPPAGSLTKVVISLIVVTIIVIGFFVLAGMLNPPRADAGFQKAVREFSLGKAHWNAAQDGFMSELEIATASNDSITAGRIRNYLGRIALGKSDPQAAASHFSAAIKLLGTKPIIAKEDYLSAQIGLADTRLRQSHYKAANRTLQYASQLAVDWKPAPEVRGDLAFAEATLALKYEKRLDKAISLYEAALHEYVQSESASAEKKASAWLECAKLFTTLKQKEQATLYAQRVMGISSSIADEVDRSEFVRTAQDILHANKTVASDAGVIPPQNAQAPQGLSLPQLPHFLSLPPEISMPQPSPGAVTQTDVDLAKGQADLKQQQLEQLNRTRKYVEELGRAQDENFRRTTENLKRYSSSP